LAHAQQGIFKKKKKKEEVNSTRDERLMMQQWKVNDQTLTLERFKEIS
jgi:hypothetical protein